MVLNVQYGSSSRLELVIERTNECYIVAGAVCVLSYLYKKLDILVLSDGKYDRCQASRRINRLLMMMMQSLLTGTVQPMGKSRCGW